MFGFISTTPLSIQNQTSSWSASTQFIQNRPIQFSSSFVKRHSSIQVIPKKPQSQNRTTISAMDTLTTTTTLLLSEFSDANRGPLFATSFVFFLTLWGSVSFVKGSTKPRITQASFTIREPASSIAKKTTRYLMERSFTADPAADGRDGVMTFRGKVRASSSVASILVAVVGSALWTLTYVLNFVLPESLQSPYWSALTLLSVAIVPWYWKAASRTEEVKVMVEEEEDTTGLSTLYVKGHRDEIGVLETTFQWKRNEPVYEDDKKETEEKQPVTSGSDNSSS